MLSRATSSRLSLSLALAPTSAAFTTAAAPPQPESGLALELNHEIALLPLRIDFDVLAAAVFAVFVLVVFVHVATIFCESVRGL